ncbi:DNA-processing protein DprA [Parvularcula maris]|uniref:DNA-processing protein DprA n=1 Tax=Parvularcula maris TaxID=2965077 RepID=A0A9X2LAH4_9PROT|nr:DNA-processing protein DprA [Parvularcula maris]MCQ8186143.1 DNA-processing protein DprA [Parvularcula maris]
MGTPITTDEKLARLRLIRSRGIGPLTFAQLMARTGSALAAIEALPEMIRAAGRKSILLASRESAEAEWAAAARLGIEFLFLGEPDYPQPLSAIADPPPVLSVRGRSDVPSRRCVAIVGARKASAAGLTLARRFAAELTEAGFVVVSGLARGIDGAAHQGALQRGTVAVLAGGADSIYPSEHQKLYGEIAESGAILSEQPLGLTAKARDFPKRNRIVSGLSAGVVIIEAAERSGTLITARLASEQGREVFAVPGSPLDERSRGANALIRNGATLVQDTADILAELEHARLPEAAPSGFADENGELSGSEESFAEEVLGLLGYVPTHRDVLIRETGAPPAAVAAALLDLVLSGKAEETTGGGYVRSAEAGSR